MTILSIFLLYRLAIISLGTFMIYHTNSSAWLLLFLFLSPDVYVIERLEGLKNDH